MEYSISQLKEDLDKINKLHEQVKTYLNILRNFLENILYKRDKFDKKLEEKIKLITNNAILKNRELHQILTSICFKYNIY